MDINSITIGQAREIASFFAAAPSVPVNEATKGDGRAVIVRSRDAGVLFGEFAGNDGSTVHLKNAVQLWQWKAQKGGTLIDVATYGVNASGCKFSISQATVTIFNACALIDVTEDAATSIRAVKASEWR